MGGGLLFFEADREGFDPAEQQPRVERAERAAGGVDCECEPVAEGDGVGVDDAGHEVVVPREVFGARLVDDIRA